MPDLEDFLNLLKQLQVCIIFLNFLDKAAHDLRKCISNIYEPNMGHLQKVGCYREYFDALEESKQHIDEEQGYFFY